MPHKDIENLGNMGRIYFGLIALVAGLVQYFKRELTGVPIYKKVFIFMYDAVTAGSISIFSGLIVYSTYDNLALALGVGGIFGHLGNRALYLLELAFKQKLDIKEPTENK